ncbi:hypothetical protein GCM10027446_35130 [Angustibacter peucedani]
MYVEKCWDEVWIAVKFQTNLEIAGSLRNSFRVSLGVKNRGGRATVWTRGPSWVTEFR